MSVLTTPARVLPGRTADEPLISLKGIDKTYRTGKLSYQALRSVDLEIAAGEMVAVVGPSGSGKTTIMNMITGIDAPSAGEVLVGGRLISTMKEEQLAKADTRDWRPALHRGPNHDIRRIFATEGLTLSLLGWAAGIPLGYLADVMLMRVVDHLLDLRMPFLFPTWNPPLARAGTIALSLLVMVLPLRKATSFHAGEALRYQ
jgi:energy-coupling factor transporter ATP-binding protein EcfA2